MPSVTTTVSAAWTSHRSGFSRRRFIFSPSSHLQSMEVIDEKRIELAGGHFQAPITLQVASNASSLVILVAI